MPRLSSSAVLQNAILSSISQMVPGPFAYAEKYDEQANSYDGLIIENGMNAAVVVNSESVILRL